MHLQPLSYKRPDYKHGYIYFRTMTLPCLTEINNKYFINHSINLGVLDLLTRNYLLIAGKLNINYYQLPIKSSLLDEKQMNILCEKLTNP
jgi:hypothetical protein